MASDACSQRLRLFVMLLILFCIDDDPLPPVRNSKDLSCFCILHFAMRRGADTRAESSIV